MQGFMTAGTCGMRRGAPERGTLDSGVKAPFTPQTAGRAGEQACRERAAFSLRAHV